MIDTAISKANFTYATMLKARGFLTVIHALPPEVRQFVDELLERGQSAYHIANQVYAKYSQQIEKLGLKPISSHAIQNYRDKYWIRSPAFTRLVIQGDESTKKQAEQIRKDFDSYIFAIEAVKMMKELAISSIQQAKSVYATTPSLNNLLQILFLSAERLLEVEMNFGLRRTVAPENTDSQQLEEKNEPSPFEMTEEKKKEWIAKQRMDIQRRTLTLDAMERVGRYAPHPITGEVIR